MVDGPVGHTESLGHLRYSQSQGYPSLSRLGYYCVRVVHDTPSLNFSALQSLTLLDFSEIEVVKVELLDSAIFLDTNIDSPSL